MPELPDVEGFRRDFNRCAAGRRVERVEVLDRAMLRNSSPQGIGRTLRGRRFDEGERRGKWLLARAEGPIVLFHFGMTGSFADLAEGDRPHRHDRIVIHLDDGALAYRNMRKFGGVWLAGGDEEAGAVTGPLGPDAARIDRDDFVELVRRRRGGIKAFLMIRGPWPASATCSRTRSCGGPASIRGSPRRHFRRGWLGGCTRRSARRSATPTATDESRERTAG